MKSILVTGASGNLGISLVNELHSNGYHVLAVLGSAKNLGLFDHLPNMASYVVNLLDSGKANTFRPVSSRQYHRHAHQPTGHARY